MIFQVLGRCTSRFFPLPAESEIQIVAQSTIFSVRYKAHFLIRHGISLRLFWYILEEKEELTFGLEHSIHILTSFLGLSQSAKSTDIWELIQHRTVIFKFLDNM